MIPAFILASRFGKLPLILENHLDEIKAVAAMFGYTPEDIDAMAEQGLTPEDLEDWLYSRNF